MKIGIIGTGNIGGTIGHLLQASGHDIRYGSRNPAPAGSLLPVAEAVLFADVVIFAGPFGILPAFAADHAESLTGKVVVNAANPIADRDGAVAATLVSSGKGSARFVAGLMPQSEVVQSFNTVYWLDLRDQAGRPGERLAMPIAGDSARGTAVASRLAVDAGFDPVIVGGLDRSVDLDPGSAIYAKSLTAAAVRQALGLTIGHAS